MKKNNLILKFLFVFFCLIIITSCSTNANTIKTTGNVSTTSSQNETYDQSTTSIYTTNQASTTNSVTTSNITTTMPISTVSPTTNDKLNFDMSNISFNDAEIQYDGLQHEITITGNLPEGVTVNYLNNRLTNVGATIATAIFSHNNPDYNDIPPMTAVLIIKATSEPLNEYTINGVEYASFLGDDDLAVVGYTSNLPAEAVIVSSIMNKKVVAIYYNAFRNSAINSISLPDGLLYICDNAFSRCTNLTEITIPNSVISLGESVFSFCQKFKTITLGNGLRYIGRFADDLENVYFNGDERDWCNISFSYLVDNPSGYTKYLYFKNENNQYYIPTSIVLPNGIEKINSYSFAYFHSMTSVEIPDSVKEIETGAFLGCKGLESIIIPDSVTSIGGQAFDGCTSVKSITMGSGIKYVHHSAFMRCITLESVKYRGTVEDWIDIEFSSNESNPITNIDSLYVLDNNEYTLVSSIKVSKSINKNSFVGYKGLKEVILENGVNIIDGYAFGDCTNLTTVEIADSVETINQGAFANCTGLTTIKIGSGVENIDVSAFSGCSNLKEIILPSSLLEIDWYAFKNCTGLENVYYAGTLEDWKKIKFNEETSNPLYYAKHLYVLDENNRYYEVDLLLLK